MFNELGIYTVGKSNVFPVLGQDFMLLRPAHKIRILQISAYGLGHTSSIHEILVARSTGGFGSSNLARDSFDPDDAEDPDTDVEHNFSTQPTIVDELFRLSFNSSGGEAFWNCNPEMTNVGTSWQTSAARTISFRPVIIGAGPIGLNVIWQEMGAF